MIFRSPSIFRIMFKVRDKSIAKPEPEVVVFHSRKKKDEKQEKSKPLNKKRVKKSLIMLQKKSLKIHLIESR
jgi:hypothetical protein